MNEGTKVEVRVLSFDEQLLPEARVTLTRRDGGRSPTTLRFNPDVGAHVALVKESGSYALYAEAPGLRADQRLVSVAGEALREIFVLGEPAMPFYYRGRVRVPFVPRPDLVAMSLEPEVGRKAEEALLHGLKRDFGLVPLDLPSPILEERVRVLHLPAPPAGSAEGSIVGKVDERAGVRRAGPIVRLRDNSVSFLTNEVVVRFRSDLPPQMAEELIRRAGLRIAGELAWAGHAYLTTSGEPASLEILQRCESLARMDEVEWAEPNLVTTAVNASIPPKDYLYGQQWHIPHIGVPLAWQRLRGRKRRTFGSPDVIIAIMDEGVESRTVAGVVKAAHPDFDGNVSNAKGGLYKVYRFYDFYRNVADNAPPANYTLNPHGVSCAGVAAALADNPSKVASGEWEGIAGAAPGCRVMALVRPKGSSDLEHANAYLWTAGLTPSGWKGDPPPDPGADVISNSFTVPGTSLSATMTACFDVLAVEGRKGKGVLLLFAAGNDGKDYHHQNIWATHAKSIAIAGSIKNDLFLQQSNHGDGIALCAPADLITCDAVGFGDLAGNSAQSSMDYTGAWPAGTSAATALVAGVAALVLSMNRALTRDEVLDAMTSTAVKIDAQDSAWEDRDKDGQIDYSTKYGYGRIDAAAAVARAEGLLPIGKFRRRKRIQKRKGPKGPGPLPPR